MDLAFVPPLYPPKGNRAIYEVKPFSSALHRNLHSQRTSPCLATAATQTSQNKKHDLLRAIQETKRGLVATADQRSSIEEALVSVEGYNMGLPIDLVKLDGTWRLQYTSAPDVLILFEAAARLPFFQVGHIFQKFECRDQSNGGVICNVVRWSIPTLLEEQEGATLPVSAKFDIVSAPATVPTSLQFCLTVLEVLSTGRYVMFIRSFRAQIPVSNPGSYVIRSVGGLYYLSYLDDNMLLGRAIGGGGVFLKLMTLLYLFFSLFTSKLAS
ncbi:putative plastid-lipid-associated protein 10 [Quercus suber]|uniref:Plastid-lipid-associated protein 10 n=1 Tax=Quercus suber TaxID=58331 RepID=A0AAW0M0I5_QUESU